MKIHLVRHFPADKAISAEAEKTFGTRGGILRPLDTVKTAQLAPKFRELLQVTEPQFTLLGHSPTVRAAATLLIGTVGLANGAPAPIVVPELYWTDESIAGIMADFKVHDVNTGEWSAEGLAALDVLGKQGADGIRRVLTEANVTEGDVLFVGHGPLTAATAYNLAGTWKAKDLCLSVLAKEGSRFVVEGEAVRFIPLE